MRKKKKIIILGLCIVFVALLTIYLGLFASRETPRFETSKVYSLPLDENEAVDVRYVTAVDFTDDGQKEVLMSYDVYSVEVQMIEETITFKTHYKEARMLFLSSDEVNNLQKSWEYESGLTQQMIATADFDGDGKLDVVGGGYELENEGEFSISTTSKAEVLLQEEDGSFAEVSSSNIPEFLAVSTVAGDFDGDGRIGFVVSGLALENDSPHHAYLFHNDGGGNFTMSPIALREGIGAVDIWTADVNSDGSLDLIIHARDLEEGETDSIVLLVNDERGEFEFQELDVSIERLVIEEFDEDEHLDFICTMVIDDFTENGYPDIIYGQPGGEVYFLGNEQGEFAEPKLIDILSEGWIIGMISADFNNDNTPDVLILEEYVEFGEDPERSETDIIGHLLLIEESAEGELSFTWEWSYKLLEEKGISSRHAVVAADINYDGWIDLILVSGEGEVCLALNKHT